MSRVSDRLRGRLARVINSSLSLVRNNDIATIPRIFFCHVPKCAGSSIVSAIEDQVYSGFSVERFKIQQEASLKAAKFLGTSMMGAREAVLAYNLSIRENYFGRGHSYCRPELVSEFLCDWKFLTILRNPVDRWISEYVYNSYKTSSWIKNEFSLERYLESNKGRSTGRTLIRYFSNESIGDYTDPSVYIDEALGNLSRFSVVGTMENLDLWVARVNRCFGVSLNVPKRNVSPKSQKSAEIRSNPKVMKKIEELCRYDLEFYDRYLDQLDPKFDAISS